MNELSNKVHKKIVELCEAGDNLVDEEQYSQAIDKFQQALELLPPPIEEWDTSTWILTALGETFFFMEDYEKALPVLQQVMHCPNAIGNPFIHLRLGQVQLELGNQDRAKDELARAFIIDGEEIFEDEDPKYLEFIKKFLREAK